MISNQIMWTEIKKPVFMALNDLYQQTIKTHNKNPIGRNLEFPASHRAEGYNPSCGDELEIYLTFKEGEKIEQIGFSADACAICTASASLMCAHAPGKTLLELIEAVDQLNDSLNQKKEIKTESLSCLFAVSKHPSRINCALLPWKTLNQALQDSGTSYVEKE